jgi:hypothetical protein
MRISPFAQEYIRKRTAELMHDACKIYTPGSPVLDRTTGNTTTPESAVKYEGPCRFWEVQAGQQVLIGDQELVMTQSFLSLPYDAPVPEGDDVVEITDCDDPVLIGTTVNVISAVHGGGLRASRKLLVRVIESESGSW